mgnify:CR=1 FL=1
MKLFKGLTERQKKFAEVYVTSSGILSNTECAIEAGYDRGSAYQRAYELLNDEICPHVVNFINDIRDDISRRYEISKDNHITELWRIREDAKKKGYHMVRLRAEELRGRIMGYYVEKKAIISAKKNIDDMTLPELYERMNKIDERQKRLAKARKDSKGLDELRKYNEQRAEERKKQYEKK